MNRRDEELLIRQMRNMSATSGDRLLAPALLAVFVVGFLLGGLLFMRPGEPPRNQDVIASIATPDTPAITRR